jgi:hypothetical protein
MLQIELVESPMLPAVIVPLQPLPFFPSLVVELAIPTIPKSIYAWLSRWLYGANGDCLCR